MKLTKRIAVLAGAGALATGLLVPTVQASDPPREPRPAAQQTSGPRFERLHLSCHKRDDKVICAWRAPQGTNAVKVVLFGSVNNGGRVVLKTLRPPAAGRFIRTIPRGTRELDFVLVTYNSLGQVVGRSAVVEVTI